MCLLVRRQKLCRRERKIIKAHYMLAYECGLRRLRSGRVAHRLSDYNRHIAYGSVYLCLFTINNHTHRVFDYLKNVFSIFILFLLFLFLNHSTTNSHTIILHSEQHPPPFAPRSHPERHNRVRRMLGVSYVYIRSCTHYLINNFISVYSWRLRMSNCF